MPEQNFEQDLVALQDYFHIPGLAALVTKNGEVIYENYLGYADLQQKQQVDSTTLFPIASVTKSFAAVLALKLAESGTLDLEQSVNSYLPDQGLSDSVKVKHLLSHTSEGVPGSFFNYSYRYSQLTTILEQAGGRSLDSLMSEHIIDAFNLQHTVALMDQAVVDKLQADLAQPYLFYGETEPGHFDPGFSTASGLAATVRDLASFDQSLMEGKLISDNSRERMFTPFPTTYGISPYGIGIFSQEFMGKKIVWGYGQEDCFSSLYLKVPSQDLTLILLANNNLMSDPARLINGDITYSLFALSFFKHFVWPDELYGQNRRRLPLFEENPVLDSTLVEGTRGPLIRQQLLAQALAASFMGQGFPEEYARSRHWTETAFQHFPQYRHYGNQTLLKLLTELARQGEYGDFRDFGDFDKVVQELGNQLLDVYPYDPYSNVYMGLFYQQRQEPERALKYFQALDQALDFAPFWYTLEAWEFLGEYYEPEDPERARGYYQKIIDLGWNMGGVVDRARVKLRD